MCTTDGVVKYRPGSRWTRPGSAAAAASVMAMSAARCASVRARRRSPASCARRRPRCRRSSTRRCTTSARWAARAESLRRRTPTSFHCHTAHTHAPVHPRLTVLVYWNLQLHTASKFIEHFHVIPLTFFSDFLIKHCVQIQGEIDLERKKKSKDYTQEQDKRIDADIITFIKESIKLKYTMKNNYVSVF